MNILLTGVIGDIVSEITKSLLKSGLRVIGIYNASNDLAELSSKTGVSEKDLSQCYITSFE